MNQQNNLNTVVLLRFNQPAVKLSIMDITSVDAGQEILKVNTKTGYWTGYHLKYQ